MRRIFMTLNQKYYAILANMLDVIDERIVNIDPNSDKARGISWLFDNYLHNLIFDEYYHDKDHAKITEFIDSIPKDLVRRIIVEYIPEKKYGLSMIMLCNNLGLRDNAYEFSELYQAELVEASKETEIVKETPVVKPVNTKFSRKNITTDSIYTTAINYGKRYKNLTELKSENNITISDEKIVEYLKNAERNARPDAYYLRVKINGKNADFYIN